MINLKLIDTADGSHTLYDQNVNEHYHSIYGAIAESHHVYIVNGLQSIKKHNIRVFEMGFGTGLNCLLTCLEANKNKNNVLYHAIDNNPLTISDIAMLNYPENIEGKPGKLFHQLHKVKWNENVQISQYFQLQKYNSDITNFRFQDKYDVVYFDAFSPKVQPEVWQTNVFSEIYKHLNPGGCLITYSVKGEIKKRLENCGFGIIKLPGPPRGKKEILKAVVNKI